MIYFDNAATTRALPEVAEKMLQLLSYGVQASILRIIPRMVYGLIFAYPQILYPFVPVLSTAFLHVQPSSRTPSRRSSRHTRPNAASSGQERVWRWIPSVSSDSGRASDCAQRERNCPTS